MAKKAKIPQAFQVMETLGVTEIWENDKGHFFTKENWALASVDGDDKRIKKHVKEEPKPSSTTKNTNIDTTEQEHTEEGNKEEETENTKEE